MNKKFKAELRAQVRFCLGIIYIFPARGTEAGLTLEIVLYLKKHVKQNADLNKCVDKFLGRF